MKSILNRIIMMFHKEARQKSSVSCKENKKEAHFRIDVFYPMTIIPPKDGREEFSVTVLVYDEIDGKYFNLGYYDFAEERWNVISEEPMNLKCWSFVPDPSEYWEEEKFSVVLCP